MHYEGSRPKPKSILHISKFLDALLEPFNTKGIIINVGAIQQGKELVVKIQYLLFILQHIHEFLMID